MTLQLRELKYELKNGNATFPYIDNHKIDLIEFADASPINSKALLFECFSRGLDVLHHGITFLYESPTDQEKIIAKAKEHFSGLVEELESKGIEVNFQCLPYVRVSV